MYMYTALIHIYSDTREILSARHQDCLARFEVHYRGMYQRRYVTARLRISCLAIAYSATAIRIFLIAASKRITKPLRNKSWKCFSYLLLLFLVLNDSVFKGRLYRIPSSMYGVRLHLKA